jgi:hypothetical protein
MSDEYIKQLLAEALKLDNEDNYQAAMQKYLHSINVISESLLSQDYTSKGYDTFKNYLSFVGLCLERCTSVLENLKENAEILESLQEDDYSELKDGEREKNRESTSSTPLSFADLEDTSNMNPEQLEDYVNNYGPVSYMKKHNERIRQIYQTRLEKLNLIGKKNTEMALTMIRRLHENMVIAKIKEESLLMTIYERKQQDADVMVK